MKKYILVIFILFAVNTFSQNDLSAVKTDIVDDLLDSLWVNPTSFFNKSDTNWRILCSNLQHIGMKHLNDITYTIFNGKNARIENESASSEGYLGSLNKNSQEKKQKKFNKKIAGDFYNKEIYPDNKVVLVEGDSWFEYPLFLRDISDNLIKQNNLAVYSIASDGDWAANMISSGDYKYEYLQFLPDVFIVSGGGNDMVENGQLKKLISNNPLSKTDPFLNDYKNYVILRQNKKAVPMCNASFCPIEYHLFKDSLDSYAASLDSVNLEKIVNGRRYLNKNFYRFLVSFKLEYKILFESIRKLDSIHFDSLKILTQGYDYAIPNSKRKFGIRTFIRNGVWLKEPLEEIGIYDKYTQESIIMCLIFDFNEMLIELGKEYKNIYHVDVRGFTSFFEKYNKKKPGSYWYDELHPVNKVFAEISKTYIGIINDEIRDDKRVFNVIRYFKENNK